jgi:putative ABC transport system substrate-binding protein
MKRRAFVAGMTAVLAAPLGTEAQPRRKLPTLGVVQPQSAALSKAHLEHLREGLRLLGYIEGQNIAIEYRFADGKFEHIPAMIEELIRLNIDILVVGGTTPAQAAQKATKRIPIIFAGVSDPVEAGLVMSLSRPGANVTGASTAHEDGFAAKWIQLLRDVVPQANEVAVLHNPSNPSNVRYWRDIRAAATTLAVRLTSIEARDPAALRTGFDILARRRHEGLVVVTDPFFFTQRQWIVEAVSLYKLPSIFGFKEFVITGGLLSYGASVPAMYRRVAIYVDKVLKGATPGELPVEQPTQFELVINLKTAKALGLTIPPSLLLRADQVIE